MNLMQALNAAASAADFHGIPVLVFEAPSGEHRIGVTKGRHWEGFKLVAEVQVEDATPADDLREAARIAGMLEPSMTR